MVRNYQRKTDRGKWSEEKMMQAVLEVTNNRMGSKRAAESFGVPQTTLERKVKKFKGENLDEIPTGYKFKEKLGPISTIFSIEEEKELVEYIKLMENRLFGLSTNELRKLAYQLAQKNNKKHSFNDLKAEAGKDWVAAFLKRNPTLSIRKPEATSIARAMAFNKENVGKFYSLLGELYDKHKFTPDRIFNCDESGISSVSKNTSKILATKGKKQVGLLSSAERGKTVTVEFCMSASGLYMPPLLVYPRQRMKPELLNNCYPGMWAECNISGWMQKEIFENWFERFIEFSGATIEKPVLLLLDGHSTHVQSIKIIDRARETGVIILCFPPHCTHRLQPLDIAFMKPLSVYYDQEISNWLRSNPGKAVTMAQIAEILSKAFVRAATMTTAINGFQSTGIWPFNPNIFPDSAFSASATTDRPEIITDPEIEPQNLPFQNVPANNDAQPGCSHWGPAVHEVQENDIIHNVPSNSQGNFTISPEQILPLPHVGRANVKQTNHKKGKTVVITSSPYKHELMDSIGKKLNKDSKKDKNQPAAKKSLFSKSKENAKKTKNVGHQNQKRKIIKQKEKEEDGDSNTEDEEEDANCLYCGYLYSQSDEGWVACIKCHKWAHCSCAGEEDDDDEVNHICELCK
jgi:hypothetical protein